MKPAASTANATIRIRLGRLRLARDRRRRRFAIELPREPSDTAHPSGIRTASAQSAVPIRIRRRAPDAPSATEMRAESYRTAMANRTIGVYGARRRRKIDKIDMARPWEKRFSPTLLRGPLAFQVRSTV
jgi:hypothetical protein